MKIVFIVLLMAAIGAGVYLYFSKRQDHHVVSKDLIVGKWKVTSADSSRASHQYEFFKDGHVLRTIDSTKLDTLLYEWKDGIHISWKEKGRDSTIQVLSVLHLNRDSLIVRSKDSVNVVFNRVE